MSLAAVLDGMNRTEAARIGGMDRQTLRNWVHRFSGHGPEGLKDGPPRPRPGRLMSAQETELATILENGPDRAVHGVLRWRRVDLQALVAERFWGRVSQAHDRQAIEDARLLARQRARLRFPKQDGEVIQAFKKISRARSKPMSAG